MSPLTDPLREPPLPEGRENDDPRRRAVRAVSVPAETGGFDP